MINFLLFILSGVGITNLVVNATILDNPRDFMSNRSTVLKKLLSCMMCSGFWVGMGLGFVFNISPVISGAIISLISHKFSYFKEYIELVIALKAKQLESDDEPEQRNEDVD